MNHRDVQTSIECGDSNRPLFFCFLVDSQSFAARSLRCYAHFKRKLCTATPPPAALAFGRRPNFEIFAAAHARSRTIRQLGVLPTRRRSRAMKRAARATGECTRHRHHVKAAAFAACARCSSLWRPSARAYCWCANSRLIGLLRVFRHRIVSKRLQWQRALFQLRSTKVGNASYGQL